MEYKRGKIGIVSKLAIVEEIEKMMNLIDPYNPEILKGIINLIFNLKYLKKNTYINPFFFIIISFIPNLFRNF